MLQIIVKLPFHHIAPQAFSGDNAGGEPSIPGIFFKHIDVLTHIHEILGIAAGTDFKPFCHMRKRWLGIVQPFGGMLHGQ